MNKREIIGSIVSIFIIILLLYIIIILSIWVIVARLVFGYKKIVINGGVNNYVFIEKTDVTFITARIQGVSFSNEWLQINTETDGTSMVIIRGSNPRKSGYAWDGCSPKFQILDLIIGTPDGIISHNTCKPLAYHASMIHDCLYQFRRDYDDKVLRKDIDKIFLDELRKENFQIAYVYYAMVRFFGWAYWKS